MVGVLVAWARRDKERKRDMLEGAAAMSSTLLAVPAYAKAV